MRGDARRTAVGDHDQDQAGGACLSCRAAAVSARSSCIRRRWKACISASGRSRAAGLRWSDRPQDFRTEVLGLVKAQQVKNAVIVPVGAKGGFVPGRLPAAGRDADLRGGAAGLHPLRRSAALRHRRHRRRRRSCRRKNVVRHDGDDPYLVVAADKGTATFSDTANGIALKRGFWLGDAFASGGSAGYDHKAMGITARGAWEAVKRHFREMDVDIQTPAVHGRRRRRHVGRRFRQRHAAVARDQARRRVRPSRHLHRSGPRSRRTPSRSASGCSQLPRSSWQDYDRALISKGGGVFSRAEKQIALSPEMREASEAQQGDRARPAEILSAILKAPVDLLWFGGIGTYVRGPDETNADVGDKANDAIRISATGIGAKVVGEGANLGMTPKARIAYGLKGGRCNSDAIDNSAGVNTSDVEVNIKIALAPAVRSGKLDEAERLDASAGDDRRRRRARAPQQLSADARHLARGAARARQSRQPDAADGGARGARPARPRGRGPARQRRARSARRRRARPDALRDRHAARLRQDRALGRSRRQRRARRSLSRARAVPLFSRSDARALRRRDRAASPSARHHRHPARELAHQSRRADAARRRRATAPAPRSPS